MMRKNGGYTDSNDNSADFIISDPPLHAAPLRQPTRLPPPI